MSLEVTVDVPLLEENPKQAQDVEMIDTADVTAQKENSAHAQDEAIAETADTTAQKENPEHAQDNNKEIAVSTEVSVLEDSVSHRSENMPNVAVDEKESSQLGRSSENLTTQAGSSGSLLSSYKQALEMTIRRFVGAIKLSTFKSAYPVLCKERKLEMKEIHHQLTSQLGVYIKEDIDSLCEEHNVFDKLNKLEVLIESQRDRKGKVAWRPSGNAEEDFRDHSHQQKLRIKKRLEAVLADMKESNESYKKKVIENHSGVLRLKAENDKAYANLQDLDDFTEKSSLILDTIESALSQTDKI